MHGKKSLRVAVGLEAAHLPLLLTRLFMGSSARLFAYFFVQWATDGMTSRFAAP